MEPLPSCLHLNPEWRESGGQSPAWLSTTTDNDIVGKHCILELYDCDRMKINDEAFIRTSISTAAKRAGATLLNLITYRFNPQGITGLALLAESHISVHTWPEQGYAAIDVFTCGQKTLPEKACDFLRDEFGSRSSSLKSFRRDGPADISKVQRLPM